MDQDSQSNGSRGHPRVAGGFSFLLGLSLTLNSGVILYRAFSDRQIAPEGSFQWETVVALAIGIVIAASGSGLFFGRRKWSRVILGLALPVVGLAMSTGVLLAMAKHHWFHAVG